ncbi:hypothetical protein FGB62_30g226 [Gracilaria domingensis]|nr:hypothetical protein FGB62_30g226 [Gracilaria domingensis]
MHVDVAAAALTQALRLSPGMVSNLIVTLYALIAWVQRVFIVDAPVVFWHGVTHARYLCPEQYIFSSADQLLDSDALESLIERRKREGVDARVFRVQDASHVLILRKHPDKYVEVIRALNEWGVNTWRKRNNAQPWQLPSDSSTQQSSTNQSAKL